MKWWGANVQRLRLVNLLRRLHADVQGSIEQMRVSFGREDISYVGFATRVKARRWLPALYRTFPLRFVYFRDHKK
jgi:hypothetical protein